MTGCNTSRQQLHQLVDELSEAHLDALIAFAQILHMPPVARALLFAPPDDEPFTVEDQARVERSLADPRPDVSFESVKEELGL